MLISIRYVQLTDLYPFEITILTLSYLTSLLWERKTEVIPS
jgi:hypothetical protein